MKCTGIAFASDMGPEHPTEATVNTSWILGNKWLQIRYKETKTAKNPQPIEAQMLMMEDATTKKVVSNCADSMGGSCTADSMGWKGDTMVLSGKSSLGGKVVSVRDTFTRGSGWLKHLGEVQGPKGAWIKTDEETCKK